MIASLAWVNSVRVFEGHHHGVGADLRLLRRGLWLCLGPARGRAQETVQCEDSCVTCHDASCSASGVDNMVMTNSAAAPACAGDPATAAPSAASDLAWSAVRSHTVSWWPAWSRRLAMG